MAKNDQDQAEDLPTKKARLEAEAKTKADAYAKEKADEVAKLAAEEAAKATAEREQAEKEAVDAGLVKMRKGDQIAHVHVSAVSDHEKVGWELI